MIETKELLTAIVAGTIRAIRLVVRSTTRHWICGSTAGLRISGAAINASCRESTAMNRFLKNSGDLLRQRAVFCCCPTAKRFFQMVGYVCAYKHAFPICHLSSPHTLFTESEKSASQRMNRSVSRILYLNKVEMAIIHLGQPLPTGSSDLPGGRSSGISEI